VAYTNAGFPTNIPAGGDNLNTADDQIRRLRLDLKERFNDIVDDITTDPIVLSDIDVDTVIGTPDCAVVYTNALFALPSGASATIIDFVAEEIDTGGFHDNSVNPSRLTITTAAYYRISCKMYATSQASAFQASLHLRKNGGATALASDQKNWDGTILVNSLWLDKIVLAAATDYYEVALHNNSGDAWTTLDVANKAYFMIERLPGTV